MGSNPSVSLFARPGSVRPRYALFHVHFVDVLYSSFLCYVRASSFLTSLANRTSFGWQRCILPYLRAPQTPGAAVWPSLVAATRPYWMDGPFHLCKLTPQPVFPSNFSRCSLYLLHTLANELFICMDGLHRQSIGAKGNDNAEETLKEMTARAHAT